MSHPQACQRIVANVVSGANWRYVAGEFPPGMKWKSNVRDRDVRKIKELGGKVVVVGQDYSIDELESAKKECSAAIAH
jgi:hypothetical protein